MQRSIPTVETKRLLLRPIEKEDACDVYEIYSSAKVCKYLSIATHGSVDETLQYIYTHYLSFKKQGIPQRWAMLHLAQDKVIGDIGIHTMEDGIGEIGFVLHPSYWHYGYMKEAIHELIQVSFTCLHLHRLQAKVEVSNSASLNVLKSCGFQKEGILRAYEKFDDEHYHDLVMVSILQSEWKEKDYEKRVTSKV